MNLKHLKALLLSLAVATSIVGFGCGDGEKKCEDDACCAKQNAKKPKYDAKTKACVADTAAAKSCTADKDCKEAGKKHCNKTANPKVCVECTEDSHCSGEKNKCTNNACVKPTADTDKCTQDSECTEDGKKHCNTGATPKVCVECTDDAHCTVGTKTTCGADNKCAEPAAKTCTADTDCSSEPTNKHCNTGATPKVCVECTDDAHCTDGTKTKCGADNKCAEPAAKTCTADTDCSSEPTNKHCDTNADPKVCVECTDDAHCTDGTKTKCEATTKSCVTP